MLMITSIHGNIFNDIKLKEEYSVQQESGNCEHLKMNRFELEKSRFRRKTDNGMDVGLELEPGSRLHHGDVLTTQDKLILVEQLPEKVVSINVKNKEQNLNELYVLIGHIIGNRHKPISIDKNGIIYFPISIESEIETFTKLFHNILDKIELSIKETIFEPDKGMNAHEHG